MLSMASGMSDPFTDVSPVLVLIAEAMSSAKESLITYPFLRTVIDGVRVHVGSAFAGTYNPTVLYRYSLSMVSSILPKFAFVVFPDAPDVEPMLEYLISPIRTGDPASWAKR